ncbi:hypothetical protein [Rhodanobacter sp. Root179]|uniref:hypothetical protein n=1 Tax=Rhodanobacter sp. Root179 TaxID=1736482 RepID=UPI0012FC5FA0|nr:hypothetical protein [Rhodanobacter sp. Root179]
MEQEEFVATLLFPDEYRRQLNQVAGLTSRRIDFLKSKFGSMSGGEVVQIPIEQCSGIAYKNSRPVYVIVAGVLLSLAAPLSLYVIATNWEALGPDGRVPVGALFVATLFGLRMVFGARRHELTFSLMGRSSLKWRSRPGDFKYKQASVGKVLEFARSKGLLIERPR